MKKRRLRKVILLAVAAALISVGVWLGFGRGDKEKQSSDTSQNNGATANAETTNEPGKFSNADFSFEYPKDWVTGKGEDGDIVFQSSDYALKELPGQYERGSAYGVSAGYKLTVQTLSDDAPNKTIDELTSYIMDEEKTLAGGNHSTIMVDGNQALFVNNEQSKQFLYVVVFKGQKRIHIQLDAQDDSTATTKAVLDGILSTFRLK